MGVQLAFVESYQKLVTAPAIVLTMMRWEPDLLILDEAHLCKHRSSQRTNLVFGTGNGIASMVLAGHGRVWPLSGTPMPRNPAEMFPVLYGLWPKTLANMGITSYMGWLDRFCIYNVNRFGVKVYGAKNVPELKSLLAKVMLRRMTLDVAPDLPPLRWGVVEIDVPDLKDALLAETSLDPSTRAALEAGELPPMSAQLARYRHQVGDLKAPVVAEMIAQELQDGLEKLVVFAYHRSVLDCLAYILLERGFETARIDGSKSSTQREQALDRFRTAPSCRVFLGQIEACAVGMDGLQHAAHDAVMVEPDWKTDFNVQAGKRLARIGQSWPVAVRMISLANTLDSSIIRNHEREIRMVADVTG